MFSGTLIVLTVMRSYYTLSFQLDENVMESCFYLQGLILGKKLMLEYEVIGNARENVKFTLTDAVSREVIKTIEKQDQNIRERVIIDIDSSHDFVVCWENTDKEFKEISFFYQHKNQITFIDKGMFTR